MNSKEISSILGISRQRLMSLPYIKDLQDAQLRKMFPPSKGRESIIKVEIDGVKYISVKEVARIQNCSTEKIYKKIRNNKINSVLCHGITFIPESMPIGNGQGTRYENVLMIERKNIRYISIKEAARIQKKSIKKIFKVIYQKVSKKEMNGISYLGMLFVPEELF